MDHSGLDGELINSPLACWDSKREGGGGGGGGGALSSSSVSERREESFGQLTAPAATFNSLFCVSASSVTAADKVTNLEFTQEGVNGLTVITDPGPSLGLHLFWNSCCSCTSTKVSQVLEI